MKVKELIESLKQMPQDAYVWHLWDGEARTQIKHVWLAREGRVITADDKQVCYTGKTRPNCDSGCRGFEPRRSPQKSIS